jgi:hypothetical protein
MKAIKRRFNMVQSTQPYWSSWTCFAMTVFGQNFNKQTIHRWFHKLVDKDDYDWRDKRAILKFLCSLTKDVEGYIKWRLRSSINLGLSESKVELAKRLQKLTKAVPVAKTCLPQGVESTQDDANYGFSKKK